MDEMNQYPTPTYPQGGKGFAIASMVLGIVSIVFACCLWYISLVAGIVGLIRVRQTESRWQRNGNRRYYYVRHCNRFGDLRCGILGCIDCDLSRVGTVLSVLLKEEL